MRTMMVGAMALGLAVMTACGSNCNRDCQECRDLVATLEQQCEDACDGDRDCRDACQAASCAQDDACDGEIETNCL